MFIFLTILLCNSCIAWELGPFYRASENPIIAPSSESVFHCPIHGKEVFWEKKNTFNPAAIVRDGKVYVIYRAEDDFGRGVGRRTSRIGLAVSDDGIHFTKFREPVVFPDHDDQNEYEFPGGCEDPRVVETEDGSYVMTYTQWNQKVASLAIATSNDLIHWKKHGYAFQGAGPRVWSKSGAIVCRQEGDHLIATKIAGKYWMYFGDGAIYLAISDDLIAWEPLLDDAGKWIPALRPRENKFDSDLVEAGPSPILTDEGILLLYNSKNALDGGDAALSGRVYATGQALFDARDPRRLMERCDTYFMKPEHLYEIRGQYRSGAVFIQGLVHFKDAWFLYYGAADSKIGVAIYKGDHQ